MRFRFEAGGIIVCGRKLQFPKSVLKTDICCDVTSVRNEKIKNILIFRESGCIILYEINTGELVLAG